MDRAARARRKLVDDVTRAVSSADGSPQALYASLCLAVEQSIDVQGLCWHVTDPVSGVPVLSGGVGHPPGDFERSLEFEFRRSDVLRFSDLTQRRQPIGALSLETESDPARSPRYREMIQPEGGVDELRASFRDVFGVWGSLSLFAARRFTPEDVQMVGDLAPAFTQGLRVAHARTPTADAPMHVAPAVVVLDGRDRVIAADARARDLMTALSQDMHGDVPGSFFVLAAQARKRDSLRPATARARHRDGGWMSIDASPVDDDPRGSVALILQPASLASSLDGQLRAFGLSQRERQVAQLAVLGRSTKAIAGDLFLSPWTVQDHLKRIFAKTSVSTRGDLAVLATRHASGHG
jgi:DNA-binding CsgD family transcriptional regulator